MAHLLDVAAAGVGSPVADAEAAIDAREVRKSYGSVEVLRGVDLRVPRGSVLALLGPNGAGKTTMVRILSTLILADGGRARVTGFDVATDRREVRRRISLTGQYAAVDLLQTGAENLVTLARLRGLSRPAARRRAAELLERFDLLEAGPRRVGTYSGGMRRRLDLAASLVGDPEVIFLDEPTTGLDPRSRQTMWTALGGLVAEGVTVVLTTQYLDEADRLADRIAVLDGGRIVAEGTGEQLKQRVSGKRLELHAASAEAFADLKARLTQRGAHADASERTIAVPIGNGAAEARAVLDELDPTRAAIDDFAIRSATLDDVFLALTGQRVARAAHDQEDSDG